MTAALLVPIAVVLLIVGRIWMLMRGRRIRENYVWGWLALALAIAVVGLVPGLAVYLTEALGFQLPSNMVLGGSVLLLLFLTLNHAVELSRHEDDRRRLVEEVALANVEIQMLRGRLDAIEGTTPVPPSPPSEG